MSLAVDGLTTLFDWCTPLLTNMKSQLTSIQKGQTKNFRYGTILCSFFFEKDPGLHPRVSVSISRPRDPWMGRWDDLMKHLGGKDVPRTAFDDEFFSWWEQKIIAMDFSGDLDLVLPPNAAWGEIGNHFLKFYQFLRFFYVF